MLIAIDLTSISYHLTGIERYALCITDKLISLDVTNKYLIFFRNEVHPLFIGRIDGNRVKSIVLKGDRKLIFLQYTLMNSLRKCNADKFLFFAYPSPFLLNKKGIINTIHDVSAWDSPNEAQTLNKYYFRVMYRHAAKISERIITVSNFSKQRISCILGYPKSNISVINSAVYDGLSNQDNISFDSIRNEYRLPKKYILTLSTLEPRKNIRLLLDVFSEISDKIDYDLVLVGRKGWKIDELLNKYKAKNRIHITGFVKDEHIPSIYKNSMCFVFPSLYEGFGLPPVESLALGTPVISSDSSSLPEILMDRAVYFHNNSKEELSELLTNLESFVYSMPRCLNSTQKAKYNFSYAAKKVIDILKDN